MLKALQIILGISLLLGLVFFVGGDELLSTFLQLEPRYIAALLLLSVVLIWGSCLKWRLFIKASGNHASLIYLMKIYTIGYFFNLFAPSHIGGDAARSFQLGKTLGSQADAFASTFLERFSGLLAMCILAVLFVSFGAKEAEGMAFAIYIVAGLTFTAALPCFSDACARVGFGILYSIAGRVMPKVFREKSMLLLNKLDSAMAYARGNMGLLFKALAYSFLFHSLTVLNVYVACLAVGWTEPGVLSLFVVVPLILLIAMVPLTPSGMGVQEGAFVYFLELIGSTGSQALAVALILRAKAIILAILGAFLLSTMRKKQESRI